MSETPNEGAGGVSVEGQDGRLAFWIDVLRREVGLDHRDNDESVEVKGSTLHSLSQAVDAALAGSEARERELEAERDEAEADRAWLVEALRLAAGDLERAPAAIAAGRPDVVDGWAKAARSALAGVVEAEPEEDKGRCRNPHEVFIDRHGVARCGYCDLRTGPEAEPDGSER